MENEEITAAIRPHLLTQVFFRHPLESGADISEVRVVIRT